MLRNSSQMFIHHSSSRKFLETIEDVLENPQTVPVVRERLLTVVAAAAHTSVSSNPIPIPSVFNVLNNFQEMIEKAFVAYGGRSNPRGSRTTCAAYRIDSPRLTFTHSQGIPFDPDDAMFNPPIQLRSPSSTGNYSIDSHVGYASTHADWSNPFYDPLGFTESPVQLLTYKPTQPHYPLGRRHSTPFPGM